MIYKTSHEYTDRLFEVVNAFESENHLLSCGQSPEIKTAIIHLKKMINEHAERPPSCSMCYSGHWPETPCEDIFDLYAAKAEAEYLRKKSLHDARNQEGG